MVLLVRTLWASGALLFHLEFRIECSNVTSEKAEEKNHFELSSEPGEVCA